MFRYIGNKTKLLPHILQRVHDMIGDTGVVADLMAGTGCVSVALRKAGYSVVASDVMTYSYHHLVSALQISREPSFIGLRGTVVDISEHPYWDVLKYLNHIQPKYGFFFQEYSSEGSPKNGSPARKYFTAKNASKIDAIRDAIEEWKNSKMITPQEESLLKHTLMMAANDVANISGTYGYFLSTYSKSAMSDILLSPIEFDANNADGHKIFQGFAEQISESIRSDLCYLDPPYMKRQYAANYHILETLACGDKPNLIGKSGLRDWWGQHSKLCTKTKGLQSFEAIVSSIDCPNFLISYSEDGLFSLEKLEALFGKYGKVHTQKIEYSRYRSNGSSLAKTLNEFLISIER